MNTAAKSFEAAANTNTKGSIAGLAEIKNATKYPAKTVNRTCSIEET
jgi:hypothetical protein